MDGETRAVLRGARASAQKVRLVADSIRGKSVEDAMRILSFCELRGGALVLKVLRSAVANAENNDSADVDELVVSRVFVDEGRTLKRIKPRAKGRADRIHKRSCHITVAVRSS